MRLKRSACLERRTPAPLSLTRPSVCATTSRMAAVAAVPGLPLPRPLRPSTLATSPSPATRSKQFSSAVMPRQPPATLHRNAVPSSWPLPPALLPQPQRRLVPSSPPRLLRRSPLPPLQLLLKLPHRAASFRSRVRVRTSSRPLRLRLPQLRRNRPSRQSWLPVHRLLPERLLPLRLARLLQLRRLSSLLRQSRPSQSS